MAVNSLLSCQSSKLNFHLQFICRTKTLTVHRSHLIQLTIVHILRDPQHRAALLNEFVSILSQLSFRNFVSGYNFLKKWEVSHQVYVSDDWSLRRILETIHTFEHHVFGECDVSKNKSSLECISLLQVLNWFVEIGALRSNVHIFFPAWAEKINVLTDQGALRAWRALTGRNVRQCPAFEYEWGGRGNGRLRKYFGQIRTSVHLNNVVTSTAVLVFWFRTMQRQHVLECVFRDKTDVSVSNQIEWAVGDVIYLLGVTSAPLTKRPVSEVNIFHVNVIIMFSSIKINYDSKLGRYCVARSSKRVQFHRRA